MAASLEVSLKETILINNSLKLHGCGNQHVIEFLLMHAVSFIDSISMMSVNI